VVLKDARVAHRMPGPHVQGAAPAAGDQMGNGEGFLGRTFVRVWKPQREIICVFVVIGSLKGKHSDNLYIFVDPSLCWGKLSPWDTGVLHAPCNSWIQKKKKKEQPSRCTWCRR